MKEIKLIVISGIGSALEFFDFLIFIFLANTLANLFFINKTQLIGVMLTYSIFAIGYLSRPLGGFVFSHFGDKYGRKNIFTFTLFLMGIPSILISFLPTYSTIGIFAPIILLFLRILQGLAIGAETPCSFTFVYEHLTDKIRGIGICCGIILIGNLSASFITFAIKAILSPNAFIDFGWRIPFFIGGLCAFLGMYIRRISETPEFIKILKDSKVEKIPFITLIKERHYEVFVGTIFATTYIGILTLTYAYFPSVMTFNLKYSLTEALAYNSFGIFMFIIFIILGGILASKIGVKKTFRIGLLMYALLAIPLFKSFEIHSILFIIIAYILIGIAMGLLGVVYTFLNEMFPCYIRMTGVAITYNFGTLIGGGIIPLICTILIYKYSLIMLSFCVIILSVISLVVGLFEFKLRGERC